MLQKLHTPMDRAILPTQLPLALKTSKQATASGVDAQGGAQSAINTLKNAASENLPEETKQKKETAKNKTSEYNQRTKGYLKNKMPKERREQSIWRLKKMIVEIQGHADCTLLVIPMEDLSAYIL